MSYRSSNTCSPVPIFSITEYEGHHQKIQAVQRHQSGDIQEEITRARKKIERAEKTLRNYADMLNEELITKEVMRAKKEEVDAQIAAAQAILDEYEERLATRRILKDEEISERVSLLSQIRQVAGDMETLSFSERLHCIQLLDVTARLGLDNERIYIDIYWCGEFSEKVWVNSRYICSSPS